MITKQDIPPILLANRHKKSNRRCFRSERLPQYKGIADNISQNSEFIHSTTMVNYTEN